MHVRYQGIGVQVAPACHLFGSTGVGKTTLITSLYHRDTQGTWSPRVRLRDNPSDALIAQYRRLAEGRSAERTVPTDGLPLEDPGDRERLPLEHRDLGAFDLVAEAGEEIDRLLRSNHCKDIRTLADKFRSGSTKVAGIVLNWTVENDGIARLAYKSMVAYLCRLYMGVEEDYDGDRESHVWIGPPAGSNRKTLLRTAIEMAAHVLYGLSCEALNEIHPAVKGAFDTLPDDAFLILPGGRSRGRKNPEDRFEVSSTVMTPREKRDLLRALDAVASTQANRFAESVPGVRNLARQADQAIVLLTRWDLLELLSDYVDRARIREECLRALDRTFDPIQIVELDHVSLAFEEDFRKTSTNLQDGVWIDTTAMVEKAGTLDRMLESIEHVLNQAAAVPPPTPPARPVYRSTDLGSDRLIEATHHVLFRLAPPILMAVLGLAWFLPGGGQALPLWLLGMTLLLAGAWAHRLYLFANASPSWQIEGEADDIHQRVFFDPITSSGIAPGELSLMTSPTSRLFNLGYARVNHRWTVVPDLKRFVALTGLHPPEGSSLSGAIDVLRVSALAVGCVAMIGRVVIGL